MTTDGGRTEFRSVGWHIILHDMYVAAKNEMTGRAQLTDAIMPNLWTFYYTARKDAEIMLEDNKNDSRALKFVHDDENLNTRYGTKIEHRMTQEERRGRLEAAYEFYKRLRVFDLEEREQAWRDQVLEVIEREESGK